MARTSHKGLPTVRKETRRKMVAKLRLGMKYGRGKDFFHKSKQALHTHMRTRTGGDAPPKKKYAQRK